MAGDEQQTTVEAGEHRPGAGRRDGLDVVAFELGTRTCAVPLAAVREVLRFGPIVPVPATPPVIVGATNVSGMVLPVVDLCLLLGEGEARPRLGEAGIRVADGDIEAVFAPSRVVEVARLRSAQPMSLAEAPGARPLMQVLATEHGTLHLVDVAAVLVEVNLQVAATARQLSEGFA